mmetsp:Transcript_94121/g.266242  ORF Transcript_94121/g.266242 Transcript_94121/m.266242 type:complete len:260 (-) Transcript_94121:62-841(-)
MLYVSERSPSPMTVTLIHSPFFAPSSMTSSACSPAANRADSPVSTLSTTTLVAFSLMASWNSCVLRRPSPSVSYWLKRPFDSALRRTRAETPFMSLLPGGARGTLMSYVSGSGPLALMVALIQLPALGPMLICTWAVSPTSYLASATSATCPSSSIFRNAKAGMLGISMLPFLGLWTRTLYVPFLSPSLRMKHLTHRPALLPWPIWISAFSPASKISCFGSGRLRCTPISCWCFVISTTSIARWRSSTPICSSRRWSSV